MQQRSPGPPPHGAGSVELPGGCGHCHHPALTCSIPRDTKVPDRAQAAPEDQTRLTSSRTIKRGTRNAAALASCHLSACRLQRSWLFNQLLNITAAWLQSSSVTQAPAPRRFKRNEKQIEMYSKATSGEIKPRLRARVRWQQERRASPPCTALAVMDDATTRAPQTRAA